MKSLSLLLTTLLSLAALPTQSSEQVLRSEQQNNLHLSIYRSDIEGIEYWLARGAMFDACSLGLAANKGDIGLVGRILDSGVGVGSKIPDPGFTALFENKRFYGPDEDILFIAVSRKDYALTSLSLNRGAKAETIYQHTEGGHLSTLLVLLKGRYQSGDLEEVDLEIARLLISSGANVNLQTDDGYSALMLAAGAGDVSMIDLLLANGGDRFARDKTGKTAADHAADSGSFELARRLAAG